MLTQSEMIVVFVLDETINQGINLTAMKYPKSFDMDSNLKVPQ